MYTNGILDPSLIPPVAIFQNFIANYPMTKLPRLSNELPLSKFVTLACVFKNYLDENWAGADAMTTAPSVWMSGSFNPYKNPYLTA